MNKILQFLLSMRFTAVLMVVFGITIATATFIENDFGTASARAVVYNAKWFELLLLLIMINLTGSIIQHKLYKKEKLTLFIFHLAFVIIILGAAFTRFTGFEGMMHIREGSASDLIWSERSYIRLNAVSGNEKISRHQKVLFSPIGRNTYTEKFPINGQNLSIRLKKYISNAEEVIDENPETGEPLIQLIVPGENGITSYVFRDKETKVINGISFNFNNTSKAGVNIYFKDHGLFIKSPFEFSVLSMADKSSITLQKDSAYTFEAMKIYSLDSVHCVMRFFSEKGIIKAEPINDAGKDDGMEALVMDISYKNLSREATLWGKRGQSSEDLILNFDGLSLGMNYGSVPIRIPFSLKLEDFILERYPGSDSPSSFESKVVLIDKMKGIQEPRRIYMNNILEYKGYRFFQSSYDSDELGTILSVNKDFPGTWISYFGYILMGLGMVLSIFNPSSRFRKLGEQSKKFHDARRLIITPVIALLLMAFPLQQSSAQDSLIINPATIVPVSQANSFGRILVQDQAGRIKPINTMSSEILRKVSRTNNFHGLNCDQIFLGMIVFPDYWKTIPMIRVSNDQLRETLKLGTKYASFENLDGNKGYVLKPFVENAYKKKPAERSKFDNEVLKVDERFNICNLTYLGLIAKVFPARLVNSDDHFTEFPKEKEYLKYQMRQYTQAILNGLKTGDYSNAEKELAILSDYQIKEGKNIVPSLTRTKLEIFYNKAGIFERLSGFYGLIGFILLILIFITIFSPRLNLEKFIRIATWLIVAGFIVHSAGLGIRWYVSTHAPWSNGYESMVYISWATILAGIAFSKRSRITLATTAILSFLILYVAHLSWMDPEITNLVPVLQSYWLVIHVAIITSSYGFFAMGALIAGLNLILMFMKSKKNFRSVDLVINELSCVVEMTLIVGLYLVTIGTFLGGVWANESWGRYWGWDPKETWALVTVVVYAFIAHMRFIPGLKGVYIFNLMAFLGFGSVIMTYFGVNYYLSGLHSYAKGDQMPVPPFVYYTLVIVFTVGLMAYINNRNLQQFAEKE